MKWGSPIYLKDVGRLSSKCDTKDQYFRVKPIDITQEFRNPTDRDQFYVNGGNDAAHVSYSQDKIRWTQEDFCQRQYWDTAFKSAVASSPDKATIDTYVKSLISSRRRLACETSPFVDFLSVLAILLPLLFLIYWMFLRRIYYPERNTPAIRKTVKGPRFRAAL